MALGTKGKFDKEDELLTPNSLRVKIRRFYNAWEREYDQEIPLGVKWLMVPVRKVILLLEDNLGCCDEPRC